MSTDWNDLRYFLACWRAGTLAGAGRLLKVDQTTVGRRLGALEQALGVRLFDRTTEGFVLTAAGEALTETAQAVEQGMIDLERRASGAAAGLSGPVKVATTETFTATVLMDALATLHAEHPEIEVELVSGPTSTNLLKREADVALRAGSRPTQQSLIVRRLGQASWRAYASEAYRARRPATGPAGPFDGHELIVFGEEIAQIPPARWLAEREAGARVALRTNTILTARAACAAGWGVAALPRFVGDADARLRPFLDESFTPIEVLLIVHPDLQRSGRVRAVMDHLAGAVERAGITDRG